MSASRASPPASSRLAAIEQALASPLVFWLGLLAGAVGGAVLCFLAVGQLA